MSALDAARDDKEPPERNVHAIFRYAFDRGWSVIPIRGRSKIPLIRWKAYQSKKADRETVTFWVGQWRDCNLGIVTGEISGLVVLDVDGSAGMLSLSRLGIMPRTPQVKTARGWQYYFAHPGFPVHNFAGELPGLDLRGDGGYVVGVGSVHESGHVYEWVVSPDEVDLADLPDWLLDLIVAEEMRAAEPKVYTVEMQPVSVSGSSSNGHSPEYKKDRAYALSALQKEAEKVESALPGQKHSQRLRSAIAVSGFVPMLSELEIEQALYTNLGPTNDDRRTALQTIRDGIKYGASHPRQVPPYKLPTHLAWHSSEASMPSVDALVANQDAREVEEIRKLLTAAPLTDAGNAECMAAVYRDYFRFDHRRTKWLVWDGNRWLTDDDGEAERAALLVVRARQKACAELDDAERKRKMINWLIGAENATKRHGMLSTAAILPTFTSTIEEYDLDHWLAVTAAGTLDLRTGELRPARREDLLTMSLGTFYDPEAIAPRWETFLEEIFAGDQELIDFVQRAAGYSLTGDTREQQMFLCHGTGANGKSVFLEVLGQVLGDYAGAAAFSTFDADRRNEATNDLASLKGKRLVSVIEAEEDRRLAEAKVKAVTGQDPIKCRFLYGEFFTYMPTYKLWMAVNHKPIIRGTDRGIWRRVKLVPFTQNFEGREDKQLSRTLKNELPGILNWMLVGLRIWLDQGLCTARVVEAATEEYRRESDLVGQWLEDCTVRSEASKTLAYDAYSSFRNWCTSYGYREPTQTSFGRTMAEKGYEKTTEHAHRAYKGFVITVSNVRDND